MTQSNQKEKSEIVELDEPDIISPAGEKSEDSDPRQVLYRLMRLSHELAELAARHAVPDHGGARMIADHTVRYCQSALAELDESEH